MSENDNASIVIYHDDCDDGFGAAWAVWLLFPDWTFVPGMYGKNPPDVTGKDVYLVDFSYPRKVLEAMARAAKSITVIDHHESAERRLKEPFLDDGMCPVTTIFDMDRSGAALTWRHFHPEKTMPELIRYIEDRDLWRKELSYCDEVIFALRSYPYDFDVWTELMKEPVEAFISDGCVIKRWFWQQLMIQIRRWRKRPTYAEIGGIRVPTLNTARSFSSDLAGELAIGAPFAAAFWHTDNGVVYSLRSQEPKGENVAKIAELYGGGGHKNAAGFQSETPLEMAV